VNTIAPTTVAGRTRRLYSASFKAELVEQCRQIGVSLAAVAISHGMNPNVLRRWIKASEKTDEPTRKTRKTMTIADPAQAFVAIPMAASRQREPDAPGPGIHIELHRNGITVSVTWPALRAAESAAWVREVLR
jgi:transposase